MSFLKEVKIMNDWFKWNGELSTQHGVYVLEQPPITIPAERATFVDVPGRSGSLTQTEGDGVYDDLTMTAECFVEDASRVSEIAMWLRGRGEVTFANRADGYYEARITNQIPLEKILRGNPACSFSINFRCKPFLYLNAEDIVFTRGGTIMSTNDLDAYPIITLNGSGNQTLMIGEYSVLINGLQNGTVLDCENRCAYCGSAMVEVIAEEGWPVLHAGSNLVNFTSGVSKVTVKPRWRTL